jgi:hypothetical protein
METKTCPHCEQEYPLTTEYFYKSSKDKTKFRLLCKTCYNAQVARNKDGNGDLQARLENPPETKVCKTCGQEFPNNFDYFPARNNHGRRDTRAHCRDCYKNIKSKHRKNRDPEKIKAEKRRHYRKHKATNNARSQRWYKANKKRLRREFKERYDSDPEVRRKYIDYMIQYQKDHPDWVRAREHRRRARKMKNGGSHTAQDIKRIYSEQEGRCFYCGITLFDDYHVDHKQPLSRGGSNGVENICCACPECNLSKSNKTIPEWQLVRGW